jgi:hypothetical protein
MTDTSNMPDDQRQRIIEAATLMLKQQHLDRGEECDRVGRALHATLAQLYAEAPEGIDALMMVQHLLDGKPYSMKSDNSDSIQLRIDLAHAIGATVEADALPSGLRSIQINPPSRGQAVTGADAHDNDHQPLQGERGYAYHEDRLTPRTWIWWRWSRRPSRR